MSPFPRSFCEYVFFCQSGERRGLGSRPVDSWLPHRERLEVAPGTTLDVRVQTAGDAIPVQVQQAVVRWSRPPQFGLEFVTLVPEEWARLQEVVRRIEMEPYQREAEETQKAQASS